MNEFVPVARVEDVPPGTGTTVRIGERSIAVFNVDGTFHAYEGVCLHRGGPVGDGDVEDGIVTCPWHGWQYNVATGCNVLDDQVCLRRYEARVQGDTIIVAFHEG